MRKTTTLISLLILAGGSMLTGLAGSVPADTRSVRERQTEAPPSRVETSLPFFTSFDDKSQFEGWTSVNNNENYTWRWYDDVGSEIRGCASLAQKDGVGTGCDNMLLSPGFALSPGMTYQLEFRVKNWFDSDLKVYLLDSSDVSAATKRELYAYKGNEWGMKRVEFEVPTEGTYYLAWHDVTPWRENATSLRYSVCIDDVSFRVLSNNAVPAAPADLRQVPGANGEVSMALEWTNPVYSRKGEPLDDLSAVVIYRDGKEMTAIKEDVKPGAKMTWTDPAPTAGSHTYSVVVSNTTGDADPAVVETFVGIDIPGAPTNVSVDYDADGGVITVDWERPEFGVKGGWFDNTGLRYRVVRQPGNKVLATDLTDEMIEDTDLSEYGNYIYQITTRTDKELGGTAVSKGILAGGMATLPLFEGWENPDTYGEWSIIDNNNDGHTLHIKRAGGYESASALVYDYVSTEAERDESLYSPPVYLEKGKKYVMGFAAKVNPYGVMSMDVTYGKEKNKASQVHDIYSLSQITTGGGYVPVESQFSVPETGTYYLCWHLHSAAKDCWFDNFEIREVLAKNVAVTEVRNLNTSPTVGDEVVTGVTYINRGTGNSTAFKVQLIDDDNKVLGEQSVSRPLASGVSGNVNIRWTVPQSVGKFAVRGRVVMDGDMCEADNTSAPSILNVLEKGTRGVTIGTSTDVSSMAPFSGETTYAQSIYRAEDFGGIAGNINSMSFKVRFGMDQDFEGLPFRIYLGNTTEDDLSKGWIPARRLTKVYDGKLDLVRGVYDFKIPFDTPFRYAGGNLCLFIVGDYDKNIMLSNGGGIGSYVSDYGLSATRYIPNLAAKPDEDNPDQAVGNYATYVPNVTFYIDYSQTGVLSGTVTDTEGKPLQDVTVKGMSNPNLTAVTDKEGHYSFPYYPAGSVYLKASATGYKETSKSGSVTAGENSVIDITEVSPLVEITLKGNVISATDGAPIENADIYLSGDNELSGKTDEQGRFEIKGVYADSNYSVFTVSKDGYKPGNYPGMRFYGSPETPYEWNNITLTPFTAAPYQVKAIDKGDKAVVEWTEPMYDIVETKSSESISGKFGGPLQLNVGHRYTPENLSEMGVDGRYFVKAVNFVPMCQSDFSIAIWQGEVGNEALVYMQEIPEVKVGEWNEVNLDAPLAIKPDMSVVIGYIVNARTGAYPVGFDRGPAVDGGDCIFDQNANEWTTARTLLPGTMDYNWGIRTIFGNNPNSAEVEWATVEVDKAPASKRVMTIEEMEASLEKDASANGMVKGSLAPAVIMLDSPVAYMPIARAPRRSEIKGYNVYRLEPGQENMNSMRWTKLTATPVTEMSFTDESWSGMENKPYRFAVKTFYGNPNVWGEGVVSDPTFSDGVDKGRYATVTINLSADKGNIAGAKVFLTGDGKTLSDTIEDGATSVTFEDVRFSEYSLLVLKPYYERISETVSIEENNVTKAYSMKFAPKSPEKLVAIDYIDESRLSWESPRSATSASLSHCTGDEMGNAYAFTPGHEIMAAQCSRPEQRKDYSYGDFYINGVSFYANAAVTYSPLVWSENTFGSQIQEWRQDYTVSEDEVGSWITVNLDKPIKINPDYTYYYGYASTAADAKTFTISIDKGPYDYDGLYFYILDSQSQKYRWIGNSSEGNLMTRLEVTDTPDRLSEADKDARYDIYRFADADSSDETKWTKLNSEPTEATTYVDRDWKNIPDTDMRYAVKALFYGDAGSDAAMSKVLPKGKVSLVSINLHTDNGLEAEGAKVTFSGSDGKVAYRAVADATGKCEIPEVTKPADFDVKVTHPGYGTAEFRQKIDRNKQSLTFELNETKAIPGYVEAYPDDDNSKVELNWRKPGAYAPVEGWAYWDDGTPYAGFGTSVGYCAAAQLFDPADQADKGMTELDITKIAFFPTQSSENPVSKGAKWIVKIWRINNDMSVTEVVSQNTSDVTLNEWNEIELDNPYHIDGAETLLIGYEFYGSGNAMGLDNGPCVAGKGDWANFGQGWSELTANAGFNYNILVHAYCDNLKRSEYEKAPALSEPQPIVEAKPSELSVSRADRAAKNAGHKKISSYEYPVKGYRVYRLPESKVSDESSWTLLNDKPVTDTSFSDETWRNVGKGVYRWAVKAVYTSGDSEPAFSQFCVDENGKISAIESVSESYITLDYVGDGHVFVRVPENAVMRVDDTAGMHLSTVSLEAGENDIDTGLTPGIYIFRIECGAESRSFKLIVK